MVIVDCGLAEVSWPDWIPAVTSRLTMAGLSGVAALVYTVPMGAVLRVVRRKKLYYN